ncbi:hypothetical protein ACQP10_38105 (plasmid) [Streptosporangium sandarakinum]|uniref:hypothetical protein n=1 Tax=Streptosporangium sandarakinum TaxID=1260955 RepID=UPI003D8D6358
MIEQSDPTYTLAQARTELGRQECRARGHDYEHIEALTGTGVRELTGVLCPRCGRSWPIAAPPAEKVAGYLVIAETGQATEERGQWISPRPRRTPGEAGADRVFWKDAAPGRFEVETLRLAKLVLLDEEDQGVVEENAPA